MESRHLLNRLDDDDDDSYRDDDDDDQEVCSMMISHYFFTPRHSDSRWKKKPLKLLQELQNLSYGRFQKSKIVASSRTPTDTNQSKKV